MFGLGHRSDASRGWPATPWVESDQLGGHLDRIQADDETRAFARELAETGVGRIDLGEAARALCDQAVADTDAYFDNPEVNRVQDAWWRSRAVRRLAVHPKVRRLLRAVYGRPPFAFQTLNFKHGTEQSIHSDAIHFHAEPERFMCGVWIALENIAPESGPLAYLPGSHKLPVMTMRAAGVNSPTPSHADYERTYIPALARQLEAGGFARSTAVLSKGQALVWAANLAHGGAPVADPTSTRRSLVTHYFFKGCVYHTPMMGDVEAGELFVRQPLNVRTGGFETPRRDGRSVAAHRSQSHETRQRIRDRTPVVGLR